MRRRTHRTRPCGSQKGSYKFGAGRYLGDEDRAQKVKDERVPEGCHL